MRSWIFTQNPFLNATDGSFLNAMNISTYHDSALAKIPGDAFIQSLYTSFHPLHLSFKSVYDTWISQGGKQQSETMNLSQLLQILAQTKIRQWDIKIQNIYPQNTVAYKNLLPNRRKPFQLGGQIERIHSVKALSESIGSDAALADIKTDVDNFHTQLDTALSTQKSSISSTKDKSSNVEEARVKMCVAMYANLGALVQQYAASPAKIEQFFDLQAIRRSQQAVFTGSVKAGEAYTIVKHTFDSDDELLLSNTGNIPLKFYLGRVKDAKPDGTFVTLATGDQVVLASALGNLANTYLTVQNSEPLLNGGFEVELL